MSMVDNIIVQQAYYTFNGNLYIVAVKINIFSVRNFYNDYIMLNNYFLKSFIMYFSVVLLFILDAVIHIF